MQVLSDRILHRHLASSWSATLSPAWRRTPAVIKCTHMHPLVHACLSASVVKRPTEPMCDGTTCRWFRFRRLRWCTQRSREIVALARHCGPSYDPDVLKPQPLAPGAEVRPVEL